MSSTNISNIHCLGELGAKAVKSEQDLVGRSFQQNEQSKFDLGSRQQSSSLLRSDDVAKNRSSAVLNTPNGVARVSDQERAPIDDDSSFCSTSSLCPAPICRQFWKAGSYDDRLISKPASQIGKSYLRIHPKFLHSNATSHKWAFGAVAELVDNSIDEAQNGATFVIVDKTLNPRDGNPALLIQDDGGGMDPVVMRRCLSFGFSDKTSKAAIGQYGNGFKTSSMRLGADVIVFSRCTKDRKFTQSVGLLSYTFLMQTQHDRIVVPMIDYRFDLQSSTWATLHNEQQLKNNLSILLQWSPFTTEAELLKQCDSIGAHGTKVIIYNLRHDDEGKMELDFESDPEDICLSGKGKNTAKHMEASEQHLANRLKSSLRAYLSILYLRVPENFCIFLRRKVVEYHNIANDLKYPEFILYRPQNVEGSVITTIGFLKEAPAVNVHGFNVYHKNRLILPFWHVVTYSCSRGRGVVGVLEANFIEPTHNKQDFEKTSVFQKLETRLKEMTQEYWDLHCGLLGYKVKVKPRPTVMSHASFETTQCRRIYQSVMLGKDSSVPAFHRNSQGAPSKRARIEVIGSRSLDSAHGVDVQHAINPVKSLEGHEAANIIRENKKLLAQCQEYEKTDEELNFKITRLTEELREAQREHAHLLLEANILERVKQENLSLGSG